MLFIPIHVSHKTTWVVPCNKPFMHFFKVGTSTETYTMSSLARGAGWVRIVVTPYQDNFPDD